MNKERRESIRALYVRLEAVKKAVEELPDAEVTSIADDAECIRDEEQDAHDNMPEGLQQGPRGQSMTEAIDYLSEVADKLNSVADSLEAIKTDIGEALSALDNAEGNEP